MGGVKSEGLELFGRCRVEVDSDGSAQQFTRSEFLGGVVDLIGIANLFEFSEVTNEFTN